MKTDQDQCAPECFGDLQTVFPLRSDGLRVTPVRCLQCVHKTPCLRTALGKRSGYSEGLPRRGDRFLPALVSKEEYSPDETKGVFRRFMQGTLIMGSRKNNFPIYPSRLQAIFARSEGTKYLKELAIPPVLNPQIEQIWPKSGRLKCGNYFCANPMDRRLSGNDMVSAGHRCR